MMFLFHILLKVWNYNRYKRHLNFVCLINVEKYVVKCPKYWHRFCVSLTCDMYISECLMCDNYGIWNVKLTILNLINVRYYQIVDDLMTIWWWIRNYFDVVGTNINDGFDWELRLMWLNNVVDYTNNGWCAFWCLLC